MKLKDIFYWVLLAGVLTFILYQKGIIFANFENIDAKTAYQYTQDNNTTILDVRTLEELKKDGMIADAIHIPLQVLANNLDKLQPYHDRKILVYCRSGNRSVSASRILSNAGFKVYNLSGGINAWKRDKLPLH
jgi:rhodanese-related sulfurtransferase